MIANPTVVIATLASEKFRSWNRLNGTSGSRRFRDCHQTNTRSTATPVPMSDHTEIGPLIVPQS